MWTLLHLKYKKHVIATDGGIGGISRSTGAEGEDIILDVPLGTIIKDAETGEVEEADRASTPASASTPTPFGKAYHVI